MSEATTGTPEQDVVLDEIRGFWDADAPTYDNAVGHHPRSPAVYAAWAAAMEKLLPPAPSSVLDVGAGTGFLSLIAARLGHRVTSLDISEGMLARLQAAAAREGLEVEISVGAADEPPPSGFDAVMERHVLWTLQDPGAALASWREAVPHGRLVLVESLWGRVDPLEKVRAKALDVVHRLRRDPPDHHSHYSDGLRSLLPLGGGTAPSRLLEMAAQAGWTRARMERLRDVEWAERSDLPLPDRLIGVAPRFAIVAV